MGADPGAGPSSSARRRRLRAGHWGTTVGMSLENKVLGILGLGRLGGKVAKVGVAFEMSVIAWSQNLTAEQAAAAWGDAGHQGRAVCPLGYPQRPRAAECTDQGAGGSP